MKSSFNHIHLNVSDAKKSFPFYKDFFGYLEYKIIEEGPDYVGFTNGTVDFWIAETESLRKSFVFHRKNTGINHFAFKVESKEEVDRFNEEFLKPRKIFTLYRSPKLFPEYTPDYYAVLFEDPDRIKLEVAYY